MRQVAVESAFHYIALFCRQVFDDLGQPRGFLLQFQRLHRVRLVLFLPGQVFRLGPVLAAQSVDFLVPGDGEYPGRHGGAGRVEQMRLTPECDHDFLAAFLGQALVGARLDQKGFHTRSKMIEQLAKRRLILPVADSPHAVDPEKVLSFL